MKFKRNNEMFKRNDIKLFRKLEDKLQVFPAGITRKDKHLVFSVAELCLSDVTSLNKCVHHEMNFIEKILYKFSSDPYLVIGIFQKAKVRFKTNVKSLIDVIYDIELEDENPKLWESKWGITSVTSNNQRQFKKCCKYRKKYLHWFRDIFILIN